MVRSILFLYLTLSGLLFANAEPEAANSEPGVQEKKGKEIIPKLIPYIAEPTASEMIIENESHHESSEEQVVAPKKKIKKPPPPKSQIAQKKETEVKAPPQDPLAVPLPTPAPVTPPAPVVVDPTLPPTPIVETVPTVNPAPEAPLLLPIDPKPEATIQPLQAEAPKPDSENLPPMELKEESEIAIIFYRNRFFPSRLRVREGKAIRFRVANLNTKPAAFFIESLSIQKWITGHEGRELASEIPKEILESKSPKPGFVEIKTTFAKGEYLYRDPVSGAYGILEVD